MTKRWLRYSLLPPAASSRRSKPGQIQGSPSSTRCSTADFNLLQFVQGECPAASLAGIRDLSDAAYDLLVAEALLDLAGQAGLPPGAGSAVVNRATWEAVNPALQSLDGLRAGKYDVVGAWKNYYKRRGEKLGLDADNVIHFALIRVGCQLRWLTPAQGRELLMGFAEFSGYANREFFVGNLPACTPLATCLWGPVARLVNLPECHWFRK